MSIEGPALRRRMIAAFAWLLPIAISCAAFSFVLHAAEMGLRGISGDAPWSHLFAMPDPFVKAAMSVHMIAGALITFVAPLQLIGPLRRRVLGVHRLLGYRPKAFR